MNKGEKMTNKIPGGFLGLRHLALHVINWEEMVDFYVRILGMQIEWQPDEDNIYLTSGHDNLALHRAKPGEKPTAGRLDHLGFIIKTKADVDAWYDHLNAEKVLGKTDITFYSAPKNHRDGAKSFYCADPDANAVQIIYHPPLSD